MAKRIFIILLSVIGLMSCDDMNDASASSPLTVIIDSDSPAGDKGAIKSTECFANGMSRTGFSVNGNEAEVTFTRADYIVVLAQVRMHGANGILYGGEVEIILPDQTRVYNVMKNSEVRPRTFSGDFNFMKTLALIALNQRYVVCAPQNPGAFWRPKYIPPPPAVPEIVLP
jgi:hypothetical protein